MALIPLPPEIVRLANALGRGLPTEALAGEAADWLRTQRGALERQGDHFLSEADAIHHGNLVHLAGELEGLLAAGPDEEGLLEAAYPLAAGLREFTRRRTRAHFLAVPALDALLVALVATLQGRGGPRAVADRLPGAREALSDLERDRPGLPEEVRQALEVGLARVGRALAALETGPPDEVSWRRAATDLKDGGHLLAHLASPPPPPPSAIPVGGADLAALVREPTPEHRSLYLQTRFQDLAAFWAEARERALLRPAVREDLLDAVDRALVQLEQALATGAGLVETAEDLEAAFDDLSRGALDLASLGGTPLEPAADVAAGAWMGAVPDRAVAEAALRLAGTEAGEALARYLEEGERGWLLEALDRLADGSAALPSPEGERTCLYCGAPNPPEATSCGDCGAAMATVEFSG